MLGDYTISGNRIISALLKYILVLVVSLLLVACNNSTLDEATEKDGKTNPPVFYQGQALLGLLAGASIEVYKWPILSAAPIYTGTTEGNELGIERIGLFDIPENILTNGSLYLIRVRGGEDFDANVDGVIDDTPTVNLGTFHALITDTQIRQNDFAVTVLTELVYHRLKFMLAANYGLELILQEINRLSSILIKLDIDGDTFVDSNDLIKWKPLRFSTVLFLPESSFNLVADNIRENLSIVEVAESLTDYVFGSFRTQNTILSHAISGNRYYATDQNNGLNVFDISDPLKGNEIDISVSTDVGLLEKITIENDLLIGATNGSGVRMYDLKFTTPLLVGNADPAVPSGTPEIILKNNDNIYVFSSDQYNPSPATYMHIFSIGVNQTLAFDKTVILPVSLSPTIVGNYLYLVTLNSLTVVDIQSPNTPIVQANPVAITGNISDMVVKGDYLLASNFDTGITVIDISNPISPTVVPSENLLINAGHISLNGDTAYIGSFGLIAVNVADPTNIQIIGQNTTPGVDLFTTGNILFQDEYAYIPVASKMLVSSLRISGDAALISRTYNLDNVTRLTLDGGLYVLNSDSMINNSMSIVDTVDPAAPHISSSVLLPSRAANITKNGNYLYVANIIDGITVIDISNPKSAFVDKNVGAGSGQVQDIIIFSKYAFVANSKQGLEIYDIGVPETPVLINTLASIVPGGQIKRLALKGNTLLVFDQTRVLFLNISNPLILSDVDIATFIINEIPIPGNPNDIRVYGDLAFVTAYDSTSFNFKIITIDVTTPDKAFVVSSINGGFNSFSTYFDGRYLYVSSYELGIWIYDYFDNTAPQLQSIIQTPGRNLDIAADGSYIYSADNSGELRIYKAIVKPL